MQRLTLREVSLSIENEEDTDILRLNIGSAIEPELAHIVVTVLLHV